MKGGDAVFLEGLDALDQRIVRLLIENARASYSEIGERVGISRVAVKARIQALEQRGIIEEYTTIINPQRISGAVSCYFEIELSPEHFEEAVNVLRENPIITQIYRVTGRCRLHVHAVASSNEEMDDLLAKVIDPLPGLLSCSCNIILSRICPVFFFTVQLSTIRITHSDIPDKFRTLGNTAKQRRLIQIIQHPMGNKQPVVHLAASIPYLSGYGKLLRHLLKLTTGARYIPEIKCQDHHGQHAK